MAIRDGRRTSRLSKTHWIGDKAAYEKFREYEDRARDRYEHKRAVNAALFADEMSGSPASDLHGVVRKCRPRSRAIDCWRVCYGAQQPGYWLPLFGLQ